MEARACAADVYRAVIRAERTTSYIWCQSISIGSRFRMPRRASSSRAGMVPRGTTHRTVVRDFLDARPAAVGGYLPGRQLRLPASRLAVSSSRLGGCCSAASN